MTDAAHGRPIRTLCIANRGEIVGRIGRSARALGIEVVVPPTEGPDAVDLLDGGAVIAFARASGADALHPGYGFLAESAAFAEAVETAGVRWVGPPASAIRAMGDKAAARRLAASLGVPVIPGYDDPDQSDQALREAADALGLPLLVKPSAGGGGKGMRVVRSLETFGDALASARREALAAFGDDRLILERLVEGPRHIEIQVLFDAHGAGVHLGERDCSLQRRHQKILEESPSPAVDAALRERMGDAALRLATAVGYESAGTVEFLLDDHGSFWFLEMNTRLQVEHPVTEEVTGRDLVADQLRIAAGSPLDVRQADVSVRGHAMEVRVYAEDAEAGFLPATGRIEALHWPAGDGIRVEPGIALGDVVGERFDPMLAKIIASGPTRTAALDRLGRALDDTVILGLVTNLRFLRWVVHAPVVRDGQVRIDTLDRVWPPDDWQTAAAAPPEAWGLAAAVLSGVGATWGGGWRLNAAPIVTVASEGEERGVTPATTAAVASIRAGRTAFVDVGGRSVPFGLRQPPDVDAPRRDHDGSGGAAAEIRAPMPGSVLGVHVDGGDAIEAGQALVTLEAMKMEHVVVAPGGGRVLDMLVHPGDQVTRGQMLLVVGSRDDGAAVRE